MTCIGWCDTPEMCEDSASCLKEDAEREEWRRREAAQQIADHERRMEEERGE